jgi:uncharacterized hydrophobic protein (TIGR00271 family)
MNLFESIFRDNMFRKDDLGDFVGKFYYEGRRRKQYLVRFGVLTILSAIIATYGVLQDSTATVIGAMIIAPLMMPIMAMATALVMGRLDRAFRSFLTVTLGALAVILIAWFLSETYFGFISLETNGQITSRVAPNITDLFVALASGAVAAFAMSRDDINDSLPGAAIAIALVPPLAVVGVCLSVGNGQMASGAFLLFLTNFLSIIVAGSLVLHLLGLSKMVTKKVEEKIASKKIFRAIALGMLFIIIPLAVTTYNMLDTVNLQNDAQVVVSDWVDGSSYHLYELDVSNDIINITIAGSGDMPSFIEVVEDLEALSDKVLTIKLNAVQSQYHQYPEPKIEKVTN